jgi:hypothetical protein
MGNRIKTNTIQPPHQIHLLPNWQLLQPRDEKRNIVLQKTFSLSKRLVAERYTENLPELGMVGIGRVVEYSADASGGGCEFVFAELVAAG